MTNPRGMPGPPPLGLNIDWCISQCCPCVAQGYLNNLASHSAEKLCEVFRSIFVSVYVCFCHTVMEHVSTFIKSMFQSLTLFSLDTCKPCGSHSFHSDSSDLEFDFSDSERTEAFSEIRAVQGKKPFDSAVCVFNL